MVYNHHYNCYIDSKLDQILHNADRVKDQNRQRSRKFYANRKDEANSNNVRNKGLETIAAMHTNLSTTTTTLQTTLGNMQTNLNNTTATFGGRVGEIVGGLSPNEQDEDRLNCNGDHSEKTAIADNRLEKQDSAPSYDASVITKRNEGEHGQNLIAHLGNEQNSPPPQHQSFNNNGGNYQPPLYNNPPQPHYNNGGNYQHPPYYGGNYQPLPYYGGNYQPSPYYGGNYHSPPYNNTGSVGFEQSHATAQDQLCLPATQSSLSNTEGQASIVPDVDTRSSTFTTRSCNNINEDSAVSSTATSTQRSTTLDSKPKAKDSKVIDLTSSDEEDDKNASWEQAFDGTETEPKSSETLAPADGGEKELSETRVAFTIGQVLPEDALADPSKGTVAAAVEKEKKDDGHKKPILNRSSSNASSFSENDTRSTQVDNASGNNEEVDGEEAATGHDGNLGSVEQQTQSNSSPEDLNSENARNKSLSSRSDESFVRSISEYAKNMPEKDRAELQRATNGGKSSGDEFDRLIQQEFADSSSGDEDENGVSDGERSSFHLDEDEEEDEDEDNSNVSPPQEPPVQGGSPSNGDIGVDDDYEETELSTPGENEFVDSSNIYPFFCLDNDDDDDEDNSNASTSQRPPVQSGSASNVDIGVDDGVQIQSWDEFTTWDSGIIQVHCIEIEEHEHHPDDVEEEE